MSFSLNLNQFEQIALKGDPSLIMTPNAFSVQVDPDSTETIYPGDALVLTTEVGGTIIVDKAAITDVPIGYAIRDPKQAYWTAGMQLEMASEGSIINLECGVGGLSRGNTVEWKPTTSQVILAAGVYPASGIALDNATIGNLVRVMIRTAPITAVVSANAQITGGTINGTTLNDDTLVHPITVAVALNGSSATPALALNSDAGDLYTIIPAVNATLSVTGVGVGQRVGLVVTTSGTDPYILTFGTGFKSTGTLNTGASSGKVFVVDFLGDGTNLNEVSRTAAM